MKRIFPHFDAFVVLFALGALLGCQGVSGVGTTAAPAPAPATPQLAPASPNVSFGNVPVGTSQSQPESLSNAGTSSVTITQAAISGSGFSLSGLTLPMTLAVGQSVPFGVVFQPQSAGSVSGKVTFGNGASSSLSSVELNATGVSTGTLTATPSSLSFGSVNVGSFKALTDTLKNTGSANLTITSVTVDGTDFTYAGLSLPLTLAPNQSATFTTTFAPLSGAGYSGNLWIVVSGSSTPVGVALSGTGVAPAGTLTASPSSIDFSGLAAGKTESSTETVQNTGSVSVVISKITASGTGFSVSGIATPVTLSPGQSTSFSVTFSPQSAGSYSGYVTITSNATDPSLIVSLSGSATGQSGQLNATAVNVGTVTVGKSGIATGTLTAIGASVTVTSVSISGGEEKEFSISGITFPVTVTTSKPVTFTVTFTPTVSGAASATASFVSNSTNSPAIAALSGTGVTAAGQLSVSPTTIGAGNVTVGKSGTATGTLTATGASVTVTSVSMSGANAKEFSISGLSFPVTVTTSKPVTFTVTFTPTASGAASASASFASNASNSPTVANLTGTGVASPGQLSVSPTTINAGSVTVGKSGTATGTLTATGATVTVTSVSMSGTNAKEFSVSGLSFPVTVTTSKPVTFTVTFTPTASGAAAASASFASNASNSPTVANLTGTGVAAPGQLSVSPTTINAGSVTVGKSGTATGTLTATGATVTVTSVSMSGTNAKEFSVSGLSFPVTVTTSKPVTFTVTFTPTASGAASASASFASNASNSPTSASLSGTGVAAGGQLSVSPTTINAGSVTMGTSANATGTLTSTGASVIVSSVTVSGANASEFSIGGISFPVTVTTSKPVTFTVTFTPQASGAAWASASFASNATNSPTVATLEGTGVAAPNHWVNLSWQASTSQDVVSYNVYRAPYTTKCGSYAKVGSSANITYTDSSVVNGQAYCYEATAVNSSGEESGDSIPIADVAIPSS